MVLLKQPLLTPLLETELRPQVANIKIGIALKVIGVEDGVESRDERQVIV